MYYLLAIVVHAANIQRHKIRHQSGKKVFVKYPTIEKFCGNGGYRKSFEQDVSAELGLTVDISKHIRLVFEVMPKRWVVKRTFSWANNSRRLYKDIEIKIEHKGNMRYDFSITHVSQTVMNTGSNSFCLLLDRL
jgi:hypothetical protein